MFTSSSSEILPFFSVNFFFQGRHLEKPKYAFEPEIYGEGSQILGASCHAILIKR